MRRYGRAIEYDLFRRGLDLGTEWRARRWRRLLNLIDQLPRNSRYVEAITQDEDLAQAALTGDDRSDKPAARRMSEWSAEVELLTVAVDRLAELIQVTVAARGAKPREVRPAPRPQVALERVRARNRVQQHRALVARVLPHTRHDLGGPPPP